MPAYFSDTTRIEIALPGRCLHFISAHLEETYRQYISDLEKNGTADFMVRRPGIDGKVVAEEALVICRDRQNRFGEIARTFSRSWGRMLVGETDRKMQKLAARLQRAMLIVLPPGIEMSGLSGLVRVHYLVQEMVNRGAWDPDDAYLKAFDALSELIQSSNSVADNIDVIAKAAEKAAPKMLAKLQAEGYYRRTAMAA